MKKKNKVLATSVATIALCASLVAGGTYALFTSESEVNIAVTSGTVDVRATAGALTLYSNNEKQTGNAFANGGTATKVENEISIDRMTPMDSVNFDVKIENYSDVKVQYRTVIKAVDDTGLFEALDVTFTENNESQTFAGGIAYADWATLDAGDNNPNTPEDVSTINVNIEFPNGDNQNVYQGKSCKLAVVVEAVQANADVVNPITYENGIYYVNSEEGMMLMKGIIDSNPHGEGRELNFKLTANMDMTGYDWNVPNAGFTNIDGDNYTVSNLVCGQTERGWSGFLGYFGGGTLKNITLENVTAIGSQAGVIAGHADGGWIENVTIKGANTVAYEENAVETWGGVGALLGVSTEGLKANSNITVASGATISVAYNDILTESAYANEYAFIKDISAYVTNNGTISTTGKWWITVATVAEFREALASSNEVNIYLADGTYNDVLTATNKTINIKGGTGAVIGITRIASRYHDHLSLQGCTVTLEGVSVNFADGCNYAAFINNPTMTYIDCTIKGQFYIYGDTNFIGCTFDNDDEAAKSAMRYTYIYDGDVLVDDCDFYTQGHALIMFKDQGVDHMLTVKDSRFHGGAGRTAYAVANQNTAAIEIDGSCGANYTLNLEGNNTFDEGFSGLWRIKAMKDGLTTKVNGTPYTGGTDTVYVDGVKYYKDANRNVYAYDGEFLLVNTATELQTLLNLGKTQIKLAKDIVGNVTVTQSAGVEITIEGNNKNYAGVILVDGKSATYTTAGLAISNLKFVADSISADACIRLGDGTNATRYTCNVTVSNCTFDVNGAVGVKSYTGGDKNLTITGCTATANAHSLVQAKGIDGILVQGCFVYSKNGMNFNNSTNVTVDNCTADVKGYAVRFGESSGGVGAAETYEIKNSTLKSACEDGDAVIILRGTADYATLTITNTTLTGSTEITNTATGATVVR